MESFHYSAKKYLELLKEINHCRYFMDSHAMKWLKENFMPEFQDTPDHYHVKDWRVLDHNGTPILEVNFHHNYDYQIIYQYFDLDGNPVNFEKS